MILPPYAVNTDVTLTLPTPSAGKAIVWNSSGTNLENSTVAVNELESTLNGYKTAAQSAATTASDKADIATTQAQTATVQATIATTKANEAATSVNQLNGMRSNCITDIPQDIKLTLSSGTLTLKAGSKVYVPNGGGVFEEKTIASDISFVGNTIRTSLLCCSADSNWPLFDLPQEYYYSGSTAPTVFAYGNYACWYDTTNNVIKTTSDAGVTWVSGASFPICKVTETTGGFTSINETFNGIGYIGSTVFVLPGVKGLCPDGRNQDGTLKSKEIVVNNVIIGTSGAYDAYVLTDGTSLGFYGDTVTKYIPKENKLYDTYSGTYINDKCVLGMTRQSSGSIVSVNAKTTFHALDYNDKSLIISWGIPDYSAGIALANNTAYICPKSGFIISSGLSSQSAQSTATINSNTIAACWYSTVSKNTAIFVFPVSAGDNVTLNFTDSHYAITFYPMKGV